MFRHLLPILFLLTPLHAIAADIPRLTAETFETDFLEGDCNYHSLTAASDGRLYFTIGTHKTDFAARFYRFDPATETVKMLGDMNTAVGEDPARVVPHGKVHTPLFEDEGFLYFTTHTSAYDGNLPQRNPENGRAVYPGGHFMRYHLEREAFESLAQIPTPNEGLITAGYDPDNNRMFALTWPSGILHLYDVDADRLTTYGAVQGPGEWGQLGEDWSFICRRLAVAPNGLAYGSSDVSGDIWRIDPTRQRPVSRLDGMNLHDVLPVSETGFTISDAPHDFWRNWRTILWNPNTQSFWGLHGGSTQLFEFDPANGILRSVANLRVPTIPQTRRNPYRTQLGFMLGPDNTLYYLAHGPSLDIPGRREIQANAYLLSYAIDTGTLTNHGALVGPGDARIFFSESIERGPDGHLYSVAWVETLDPARMEAIQRSRGDALPAETREVIYEIKLIRLALPEETETSNF